MQNDVVKKTLKHYIELELYANGVADDIDEMVEELCRRCDEAILKTEYINTKVDYNKIDKVIDEFLSEFKKDLAERLEEEAEKVKEVEEKFLSALYGTALTIGVIPLAKILFSTVDNRDTVKDFVNRSVNNIKRTYNTALRSSYLFGKSASDVKSQASKNMQQVARGINSGVTTAIPSFAKTVDKIIFLNNDVEVVWCATLDGNTCLTCASLSGTHYKSITDAPSTPLHVLCRCILIPLFAVSDPVPNFERFINSLDEEEQKEVLGKNRFNLWKDYNVPLNKFLNDGRVILLKDLDKDVLKGEE